MKEAESFVPAERIESRILVIRDMKVMLDSDLAALFSVSTKRLNEQVKRNIERFPSDFMFQLTSDEKMEVVANCDHLYRLRFSPNLPYAFTEHGAIMVASILNTKRAMEMSVYVVRAFIKLRQMLTTHKELARKLHELERRLDSHDNSIRDIVISIRQLMQPTKVETNKAIGFKTPPKPTTSNKPKSQRKNMMRMARLR